MGGTSPPLSVDCPRESASLVAIAIKRGERGRLRAELDTEFMSTVAVEETAEGPAVSFDYLEAKVVSLNENGEFLGGIGADEEVAFFVLDKIESNPAWTSEVHVRLLSSFVDYKTDWA